MSSSNKKAYNSSLGNTSAFFTPHPEANHLNAQDVAFELVASAKDISIATFQCFEGGNTHWRSGYRDWETDRKSVV